MARSTDHAAPPRREPPLPVGGSSRTRLSVSGAAALVLVAAFVAVAVGRTGDGVGTTSPATATTTPFKEPALGGSAVPGTVRADGTTHLRDGSEVKVRITADRGTEIYGFEAFLCAPGVSFQLDADVRPDDSGQCVSKPLSPGSDRYQQVKGSPPYQVVESAFRAGVGTDSYKTGDGAPVTITCGPGHPCQLVLKIQYPHGYGFRAFPLDYA